MDDWQRKPSSRVLREKTGKNFCGGRMYRSLIGTRRYKFEKHID
jgi:hypothetical protein